MLPSHSPAAYCPPSGILSKLPASWVPYAELIRLERPHGLYLLYFPNIVGLAYAYLAIPMTISTSVLVHRAVMTFFWTFFVRSAGCAWNDTADQDFDRQTKRCHNRPIARGALSTLQGYIVTFIFILVGFMFLHLMPTECTMCGIFITAAGLIYPFGKRWTNFPQVILGSSVAAAVPLSAYSLGLPAMAPPYLLATLGFYFAVLLLVVFYDVLYALPDVADDLQSGVKSMAVVFRNHIKTLLAVQACFITGLLAATGVLLRLGVFFFAFSVFGLSFGLLFTTAFVHQGKIPCHLGWCYAMSIVNLVVGLSIEALHQHHTM